MAYYYPQDLAQKFGSPEDTLARQYQVKVGALISNPSKRDIPQNLIGDFYAGRISYEDVERAIQGSPDFNASIGPQINTGQGPRPLTPQEQTGLTAGKPIGEVAALPVTTVQVPPAPIQNQAQTYTVQSGDTLSSIASRLGVNVNDISGFRSGNPNLIFPGENLVVKKSGQVAGQIASVGTDATFSQGGTQASTALATTGGVQTTGQTGGTDLTSLFSQFGLAPAGSLEDTIKSVSHSFGLDTITQEVDKLNSEKLDKIAEINSNPWLSEGLRSKQVAAQTEKYDKKKDALVERLKLQQDVVGKAITIWEKEREFKKDLLFKQLDLQEKAIDNARQATTPDIKEYQFAQQQGFTGTFMQFKATQASSKPTETEKTRALKVAAFAKARPVLESSKGTDTYVNPDIYFRLRNNYTEAIGDVTEFDEVFAPMLSPRERLRLGIGKTL